MSLRPERFGVQGFPTLKWFDGKSDSPEDYKVSFTIHAWVDSGLKISGGPGLGKPYEIRHRENRTPAKDPEVSSQRREGLDRL